MKNLIKILIPITAIFIQQAFSLQNAHNILILGGQGYGKSTIGNTLLQDSLFEEQDPALGAIVTKNYELKQKILHENYNLNIIDSPGLSLNNLNLIENIDELETILKNKNNDNTKNSIDSIIIAIQGKELRMEYKTLLAIQFLNNFFDIKDGENNGGNVFPLITYSQYFFEDKKEVNDEKHINKSQKLYKEHMKKVDQKTYFKKYKIDKIAEQNLNIPEQNVCFFDLNYDSLENLTNNIKNEKNNDNSIKLRQDKLTAQLEFLIYMFEQGLLNFHRKDYIIKNLPQVQRIFKKIYKGLELINTKNIQKTYQTNILKIQKLINKMAESGTELDLPDFKMLLFEKLNEDL